MPIGEGIGPCRLVCGVRHRFQIRVAADGDFLLFSERLRLLFPVVVHQQMSIEPGQGKREGIRKNLHDHDSVEQAWKRIGDLKGGVRST